MIRWVLFLLGLWVAAIVVMSFFENSLVYHPTGPEDWASPPDPRTEDVWPTAADGTRLHGWWLPRKGVNGWTAEPRDRYYELLGLDAAGKPRPRAR